MDFPGDAFYSLQNLDGIYLEVDGTVTSLPVFIKNILNYVPKTNVAFMELERYAGKWIMTKLSFSGGVTL